jgi:acetyltransferase-like isoleucine patch superfamily enzyme
LHDLAPPGTTIAVGGDVQIDSLPDLTIEEGCTLRIGARTVLRRDVEVRITNGATVILGDDVKIDRGVRIIATNGATVTVGNGSAIGLGSVLNGGDSITIGKQCLISGYVYLQTSMHRFESRAPIREQGYEHSPIALGDDVWLGAHVSVHPGCQLRTGTIVGSNAVLRESTAEYEIWAGVPAVCVGLR